MAKYNYDKSVLKGLGVGPFLNEVKVREQKIAEADSTPSTSIFNANKLAEKLHPDIQYAKISKVIDKGSAKLYDLVPDTEKGTKSLAYHRAGQYVTVVFKIDGNITTRPYTICSNPKDALSKFSKMSILVKPVTDGVVSNYIHENWKPGTEVVLSGPLGQFYYTSLRDAKQVIALAGGSGITPFFSMACAIDSGVEDFKLTILYGSRTSDDIILKEELAAIEKRSAGKVKVVHVLSDEEKSGFEHGFITADLIKKYAGDSDFSVFACGPTAMYKFIGIEVEKLKLPAGKYRVEVPGELLDVKSIPGFKESKKNAVHKIKVHARGQVKTVEVPETVPILRALENQGFVMNADCRSGHCGWCRSRLISGEVYIPTDFRKAADIKFNWIHPCSTFAKSDLEIEIFPAF